MGPALPGNADYPSLRAQLLGSTRILVGTRIVPERAWTRQAARSLLLLLLITPGHRLPRERVLDALWPDASPDTAERSLRKAVHELRRTLQPDLQRGRDSAYIAVGADAVGLRDAPGAWVDVEAFEAALAEARAAAADATRRDHLRRALTLYGGELLAGDPYAEWADGRREALRRLHRRAVLDLADLDLRAGEPEGTAPALESLLDGDPTDEEAVRAIMRALAAAGRRDEALRWHRQGVHALRSELGVDPAIETEALAREIEATVPAPAAPVPSPIAIRPHARIPAPPNQLIGRTRDVERLQALLLADSVRLVTVTGPGGVGKTRLAQEATRQLADDFADGTCYVPLAPLRDPAQVLPAIAQALGLAERGPHPVADLLHVTVRDRALLLVLDNFEHVIGAASQVAALLDAADRLRIVVTSREPLRLRAEHELRLEPLSVPPATGTGRSRSLVQYGTVQLFLHRAHAVRPGFVLTDDNAATVATICRRLDGLPLAVELAAARIREMPPEELLAGLDDRFATLADGFRDLPARQRSLHAAIAWSHGLLSPSLQALFRRLAVFAGSFTVEAAAAIVERPDGDGSGVPTPSRPSLAAVAEALDALVSRSLVQRADGTAGERFEMLETIREYGLALVSEREAHDARRAHATWYLALAERAEPLLAASDQVDWLDRLEDDLDNIRAALAWTLDRGEVETALRLASALRRFWLSRGLLAEGRGWIERGLEQGGVIPPAVRAKAILAAGELAYFLEDYPRSRVHAEAGLACCTALGDTRGMADALLGLGQVARLTGDLEEAERRIAAGIELLRPTGDARLAHLQQALGTIMAQQGQPDTAQRLLREARNGYRQAGNARGEASILSYLAGFARRQGDLAQAVTLAEDALAIVRRQRDAYGTCDILLLLAGLRVDEDALDRAGAHLREGLTIAWEHRLDAMAAAAIRALGSLAAATGRFERAAQVFGAVGAFCAAVGIEPPPERTDLVPHGEMTTRIALGAIDYSAMAAMLASLPPDRIVAEVLQDADASAHRAPVRERTRPPARR